MNDMLKYNLSLIIIFLIITETRNVKLVTLTGLELMILLQKINLIKIFESFLNFEHCKCIKKKNDTLEIATFVNIFFNTYPRSRLYIEILIINFEVFLITNDPVCLKRNEKVYFSFFDIRMEKRKIIESENE